MEFSCDDGEGDRVSGEAMDGSSEEKSATRHTVQRRQRGAGGRMVSGSNEQRSQHHGKDDQDLCKVTEAVEHRNQKKKKVGREREKKKMELGGRCPGKGRAPAFDPAAQE